ncbi:hypothetical protein HMN09_01080500 [Mycena chlorophos]|uniref:F-box domain-containing protein n=1 Tax=Mycena chlorophos TaxID=658473 RepID=A0A8H6VWL5_MYCCL|nr:hypothetical protein HMN09_01080500 [Mycena chlorophos]
METTLSVNDTFYDILTQYAAPGFERQARPLLAEAEATLARIESQIQALVVARDRQRARIAALKYAVSPIRMVPAELLTKIFRMASGDVQVPWYGAGQRNGHFKSVFRLASICAYWRQLVISDARMWTKPVSVNATNTAASYAEMVALLLKRSQPHPVDITLAASDTKKPVSAAVVKAVLACVDRWSTIDLGCNIIPFLENSLPAPKSLWSANIRLQSRPRNPISLLFRNAPRLWDLKLNINDLEKLPMPWNQLRVLALHHFQRSPLLLTSLAQCVALERLKLSAVGWTLDAHNPSGAAAPVSLSCLKKLDLDIHGDSEASTGTDFSPFFAHFTFPALKSLEVSLDYTAWIPGLGPAFAPFLGRCTSLESLEIRHSEMDSNELDAILLNIPSLTSLHLCCCFGCVEDRFFERLTYDPTNPRPAAPCLTHIDLEIVRDDFTEDAIRAMARSRWWTDAELAALPVPPRVARWKSISVQTDDDEGMAITDDFKTFIDRTCAEGLILDVYSHRDGRDEQDSD